MEKERLKFCIGRFDQYYNSINNKSAVFLGLSTFIVGGLTAAYPSLLKLASCGFCIQGLLIALIGLGVAVMIVVILASTPFLSPGIESLLYFGAISCMALDNYCAKSASPCTEEDELADLRIQVHQLSTGLTIKFRRLKTAGILFTVQFFLFIPLIIIIICNLK